jgi:hypothetical protein
MALPRGLRDWLYDRVARNRYAWFGRDEACLLPTPELAARLLDQPEGARPPVSPRILVVGGAGAFGQRLVEGLLATTEASVIVAGRFPPPP